MPELFINLLTDKIKQAHELYYRLILVVAPSGSGKTAVLQEVHQQIGAPLININLEVSSRLLAITDRYRALQVLKILTDILNKYSNDVVLFDNIEILFDTSLKQDPLRLLQELSRTATIVASWNGTIEKEHLVYATPDHPEYRRYSIKDFLVINLKETT